MVGHTLTVFALGIAVLGLGASVWFMCMFGPGGASMWSAVAYSAGFGVAMILLYTKVGILAGMAPFFVLLPYPLCATELEGWCALSAMAELAILLALAAYGFWVSLAGQPFLKDMLLTENPARA